MVNIQKEMVWLRLERILGESVPICLKKILISCGYDTLTSLKCISMESIIRIEKHVNECESNIIQELDCCHHEFYQTQNVFKFLPGHCAFLLMLTKSINHHYGHTCLEFSSENQYESFEFAEPMTHAMTKAVNRHAGLSTIMKELIHTALQNETVAKTHAQYSAIVRYFATYIFLLCGRSCYEVLYNNLPIPSISTICKCMTWCMI